MSDDNDPERKPGPSKVIPFPQFKRISAEGRKTGRLLGMYILVDKKPVPVTDTMTWASVYENRYRVVKETGEDPWRVALTDIDGSEAYVSTVFLGLDHNFFGGRPLLFETMCFYRKEPGEEVFEFQERCATWDEALEQHARGVQWARANALRIIGSEGDK